MLYETIQPDLFKCLLLILFGMSFRVFRFFFLREQTLASYETKRIMNTSNPGNNTSDCLPALLPCSFIIRIVTIPVPICILHTLRISARKYRIAIYPHKTPLTPGARRLLQINVTDISFRYLRFTSSDKRNQPLGVS